MFYCLDISFPRMGKWKVVEAIINTLLRDGKVTASTWGQRTLTYRFLNEDDRKQAITTLRRLPLTNLVFDKWKDIPDDQVL